LRCLWNRTRWQSLAEEEKVTGHASVQVGTRRGVTFGHVEYHEFTTEETKEEGKEAHANLEPFYRSLSEVLGEDVHSNWENHLAVQHFKGDGPVGFNALLFVPRREPCDLFEPKMVRNNFGLFLRRTFALVNSDALVPEWLNLVTGVVEPQKGQLALSQDELQRSYMFRKIKKLVVKKCFEMFAEIVQKKGYPQKFYVEFGRHLKLGPYGDSHLGRMAAELLQPPAAAAAVHPPGTQHDAYAKEAALHSSCTVASSVPLPESEVAVAEVVATAMGHHGPRNHRATLGFALQRFFQRSMFSCC